ncbi:MAG: WYL domain-containing protein [Myxococcota bacterium]|jgi:predicted DNA-binding transcriptional regulator YafY|nr:WYL domain-containing protein [Myxococcota bacterium]
MSSKIPRVLSLLDQLSKEPEKAVLLSDLAERFKVHPRTIKRDVATLQGIAESTGLVARVHIQHRRQGKAWVVLNERSTSDKAPGAAAVYRYAAVRCALGNLSVLGETPLSQSAEGHLAEMQSQTPEELIERVRTGFHYLPFGPKNYDDKEDVLEALVVAIVHRRPLILNYQSRAGERRHEAKPYTLVVYHDGLYLIADIGQESGPTPFAVDRILSAEVQREQTFELPEDYDPERYFGDTLGIWRSKDEPLMIRVAFEPDAAATARERRWPGMQSWEQVSERWVLRMQHAITPELIHWLRSWGPSVEVLAPPELRLVLREELEKTWQRYASDLPTAQLLDKNAKGRGRGRPKKQSKASTETRPADTAVAAKAPKASTRAKAAAKAQPPSPDLESPKTLGEQAKRPIDKKSTPKPSPRRKG